jgi:pyruvate ferredoxin oxidoreductase gamma subunit
MTINKMLEIRWHARGGQGAKTVAEFLALVALHEGKYSQGFPEYGPERAGAPIKGYTRVSVDPIRVHSAIYHPDVVVVLDPGLLGLPEVGEGIGEKTTVVVNTTASPSKLVSEHKYLAGKNLWTVDASGISHEEIGRPIPNMPMLGALVRASKVVKLDGVLENIKREFSRKFAPKILEGNLKAVRRAFEEVRRQD